VRPVKRGDTMKFYKIKKSSNPKKDTAWRWFSKYIRLRDAIKTTGDVFYAKCITCGEILPIEDMDAGHGIPGRMNSVLFNEDLVHAQCRQCNRRGGGELQMFKKVLIDMHGQEKWDYAVYSGMYEPDARRGQLRLTIAGDTF